MASFETLADAIVALKEYFPLTERDTLLAEAVQSVTSNPSINDILHSQIMNLIDGGRRVSEIIKNLEDYTTDSGISIEDLITVYYDIDSSITRASMSEITGDVSINSNPTLPTKQDGHVALIQVFPADVTPATRFSEAAALMLSVIPTHEFSRALPYLELTLVSPRSPLDSQNRPQSLSAYKFLMGRTTIDSEIERGIINSAGIPSVEESRYNPDTGQIEIVQPGSLFAGTVTGMELFTSPQTLINADEVSDAQQTVRHAPVIDKMRPFMSLKSITFDVVPTTGFNSYKSGKIQLVLHDRSRMGEIADLVRPDLYSTVELLIEYGWSHPDGKSGSNNVFGQLLDNCRLREKYGIMNSSFVFGEAGQVEITLQIFMKSVTDFATTKLAQSKKVVELMQQIEMITTAIGEIRSKIFGGSGTKEIRGSTVLDSISDTSSALSLDEETMKKVKEFLNSLRETDGDVDTDQLLIALESLYGDGGQGGKVKDLDHELAQIFNDRIESLADETLDPMLDILPNEKFKKPMYVSLGKLLLLFIAEPLTSINKFDEVQIITYSFNSGAGDMRHQNIGSYPISVSEFKKGFDLYIKTRGRFNITLNEFITYIANNFIDDITSDAYGMSDSFKSVDAFDENGEREPPKDEDLTALNSVIEERMRAIGIEDGVFRAPQVCAYVEAIPQGVGGDTVGTTILRIHVFDKQSSPHLPLQKLLDAMLDKNLGVFGEAEQAVDDTAKHLALASDVLARAFEAGLLESPKTDAAGKKTYKLSNTASPAAIKSLISQTMPTLRYGTATSGIKQISLRSLQEPGLNTVHMQRAGLGDPSNAPGVDGDVVPMQMLPTELEMDVFGCPLINFGQQFFVDLDTGTTVDNIYGVVGLSHTIEQGKFDTSIKMINIDAYGKYRSVVNTIKAAIDFLQDDKGEE